MAMPIAQPFKRVRDAYAGEESRPLQGYLGALCSYAALVGVATAVGRSMRTRLPERLSFGDTMLLALATHKASRLITKASITSVLRAPFTRYVEPAGVAEVKEAARGQGAQHAVGELLTCPFCSGAWVAGVFTAGLVLTPKATRLAMTALSAVAASDWLHLGYEIAKKQAG